MTLTFFSNFLLHHQTPFCNAMAERLGEGFHFVATIPIPQDRLDMGYHDYTNEKYVVNSYKSQEEYDKALKLGRESDVVILGDAPDVFIEERLYQNKLTFKYSERFFKDGRWHIFDPRVFISRYKRDIRYRKKNLHMLCASAYTAPDCRFIHSYPDKTYRWGYFTEIKKYDVNSLIENKKPASILWAGRMIDWKHTETVVYEAEKLKKENINFTIDIIGDGKEKEHILSLIKEKKLSDCVTVHGFMSPEEVRTYMEKSQIFLFTSDKREGWGAVLNESMNSACAPVACGEIGSVPYLIENGKNGFAYDRKKKDDFHNKVKKLLSDNDFREKMQKNAYETMINVWNADCASDRLIKLIDYIKEGKETEFVSGPCSKD